MKQFYTGKVFLPFLLTMWLSILSCTDRENVIGQNLSIQDSFIIKNADVFKLCFSVLRSGYSQSDSLVWVYNNEDSSLLFIDNQKQLSFSKKITIGGINFVRQIHSYKRNFILWGGQNETYLIDSSFSVLLNEYIYPNIDSFAYTVFTDGSLSGNENEYLLMKVPMLNLSKKTDFDQYFSSRILGKAIISDDRKIEFEPYNGIDYPLKYKDGYYGDPYILFCADNKGDIYYSFAHWDSIAIFHPDAPIQRYVIPQSFSVSCPPIPDSMIGSRTFKNEYAVIHSGNLLLLDWKDHILLFQQIGADRFIQEDGTLSEFISLRKRIIIFDKKRKKFEKHYFELPFNCHPFKSFIFNDKLFIACQRDKNVVVYETDL